VQIEQMPDPDSRVTLGRDGDPFGVRRPEVAWRLSSFDARTFARATEVFIDALRRHDLASTCALAPVSSYGLPAHVDDAFHPSGTTRMSVNERSGVVDRDLAVHGTPNLFVCGSSVFPKAGYANPDADDLCAGAAPRGPAGAADSPAKRRSTGSAIRIG
jgi:choline dehydrogenase-like flavoprotein